MIKHHYDESGIHITTSEMGDITIDTDFITMSNDTTTTMNTIDISNIMTTTIEGKVYEDYFSSTDDFSITINDPVEFEDYMPDVAKVEDMCNDYPALKKAYENFKTIYAMVHQDWKGKQDDDEHLPF